jgi:hypothetical protein
MGGSFVLWQIQRILHRLHACRIAATVQAYRRQVKERSVSAMIDYYRPRKAGAQFHVLRGFL